MADTMTSDERQALELRLQDAGRRLVDREVHYCVSSLVHTLASSYGDYGRGDLGDLVEQAFELSTAIPDYENAAWEEGWRKVDDDDAPGNFVQGEGENAEWSNADDWEELCNANRIDPHEREVYEHWIVSRWLADKLEAHGEKVDRDFAGMIVWARTTTGQAILLDGVIRGIVIELGWHKKD